MSAREMSEATARGRPLSPHMTIYRMSRYCLASSILNRLAGLLLSVGQLLLVYWLVAVAEGERAYAGALAVLTSLPLEIGYALLIAAFSYHLVAGVRHLIWDTGRGLSRVQSRRSAAWVFVVSIALALALIGWAFIPAGAR
jgi:succinate dehydrogenase cytochrome b subunit